MAWWYSFINVDSIVVFILVCLTLYFLLTRKRPKKKYDFLGFVVTEGVEDNENIFSLPKKKKKKKKINKHEERCREIFQNIFNLTFKSVRPDWLKNPATGRNLELDGFCPTIKTSMGTGLAFEYDGIQHAQYTKHFHQSGPQEFIYQDRKDAYKSKMCKEKGIMLIRISHKVIYEDLERYIRDQLRFKGLLTQSPRGGMY